MKGIMVAIRKLGLKFSASLRPAVVCFGGYHFEVVIKHEIHSYRFVRPMETGEDTMAPCHCVQGITTLPERYTIIPLAVLLQAAKHAEAQGLGGMKVKLVAELTEKDDAGRPLIEACTGYWHATGFVDDNGQFVLAAPSNRARDESDVTHLKICMQQVGIHANTLKIPLGAETITAIAEASSF